MDEFFVFYSFAFCEEYIFFIVMLCFAREIKFLRNVDDDVVACVYVFWRQMPFCTLLMWTTYSGKHAMMKKCGQQGEADFWIGGITKLARIFQDKKIQHTTTEHKTDAQHTNRMDSNLLQFTQTKMMSTIRCQDVCY